MARQSIENLPSRISRRQRRCLDAVDFEKAGKGVAEDNIRGQRLNRPTVCGSNLLDHATRADLAVALMARKVPRSLASKRFMRRVRKRVFSALFQFVRTINNCRLGTFTIVSGRWHVKPEELLSTKPQDLLQGFRSDLNRCGAAESQGFLIAWIDLEYELNRGLYAIHLHGLVGGDMVEVVNRLRGRPKYRPIRKEQPGCVPVYRPIVVKTNISDWPRAITYLLKSHWMSTWRGPLRDDGSFPPGGKSQRMPEPYHSLALLWFHRLSLKDITLMVGMEAGSFGFRRTRLSQKRRPQ